MKKILPILLLFIASSSLSAQSIVEALTSGTQKGKGTLMGAEAEFSMQWEWTLNDQFLKLTFANSRKSKEGTPIVFKANGFYKLLDDSRVVGNWFDSRGISFPLNGTITDTELTIIWGTPQTEQGKTVYQLTPDNQINVIDFFLADGQYRQFGEASYAQN
ncbi:MAG: DUF6705 family protein [Cyclobacteriaceae bacterium]